MKRKKSFLIVGLVCAVAAVAASRRIVSAAAMVVAEPLLAVDSVRTADAIVAIGRTRAESCDLDVVSTRALETAVRLYRERRAPLLVFSGGRRSDNLCTAAGTMAQRSESLGVPANAIRAQAESTNVSEDATRTDPVLKAVGVHRILLVTNALSMRVTATAFAHLTYDVGRVSVPMEEGHPGVSSLAASAEAYVTWLSQRFAAGPRPAFVSVPADGCCTGRARWSAYPHGPLVLFGDSDVARWPLTHVGDVAVINRGHAGDHVKELLSRFNRDVIEQHPRAVIIWGFDNDVFDAHPNMEDAMASVRRAYEQMVDMAESHGIEPILATEVTLARRRGLQAATRREIDQLVGRTEFEDRINKQLLDVNEWLRELARRRSLLLLELQPALSDRFQYRLPEFVERDGNHITPAGYVVLNRFVEPLLRSHLSESRHAL